MQALNFSELRSTQNVIFKRVLALLVRERGGGFATPTPLYTSALLFHSIISLKLILLGVQACQLLAFQDQFWEGTKIHFQKQIGGHA